MITLEPVTLERDGIRLEPLTQDHAVGIAEAVKDGELWKLWFTQIPDPGSVPAYIDKALEEQRRGAMLPWAVKSGSRVIGCTRYHDIMAEADRVEIGYTWYVASLQRTRINTVCKILLLTHAFETLKCGVVGLRTDGFNFRSQRAIEGLGAKKDGVLRHHRRRSNGTFGDTVMYSILAAEWPGVKANLEFRLERNNRPA
jgi:RimJ/RimL family protein N-acetyltransferase